MNQLKQICRLHLQQHRCFHLCPQRCYPRQVRLPKTFAQNDPVDVDMESAFLSTNKSVNIVHDPTHSTHNAASDDPTLTSLNSPFDSVQPRKLKRVKAKTEINPIVLKCKEILHSLAPKRETGKVEYAYKTKFGTIRFDSDNLLSRNVVSLKSSSEHYSDIDIQYFGEALNKTYQSGSSSDASAVAATDSVAVGHTDADNQDDFIDRQFFGSALDRDIKKEQELCQQSATTDPYFVHSRQDINKETDLNYIDELFFKDVDAPENDINVESQMNSDRQASGNSTDADAATSEPNIDAHTKKWFPEKGTLAMEPSECKSDFERALLDMDDESCVYSPDPNMELTPRATTLEHDIAEFFDQKSSKATRTGLPSSPVLEEQLKQQEQATEQEALPSEEQPANTISTAGSLLKLYTTKTQENNGEVKKEGSAYDYVLQLRWKEKEEKLSETGKDGELFLPKYKRIISSVWSVRNRSRAEMKIHLKHYIIYNDNDIVGIFKPYGLRVHGGGDEEQKYHSWSLMELLPELCELTGATELHHVHRLDMNTTGLMLLAKSHASATKLRRMFKEHTLIKTYLAITKCVPSILTGVIDIPLKESIVENKRRMGLRPVIHDLNQRNQGGVKAVTKFKVLSSCDSAALLSIQPQTGVKHQIRAHLGLALNCPILADHKYSSNTRMVPQKLPSDLLYRLQIRQSKVRDLPIMLHASSIFLPQFGADSSNIKISCPPPPHFTKTMKALQLSDVRNRTNLMSLDFVDIAGDQS